MVCKTGDAIQAGHQTRPAYSPPDSRTLSTELLLSFVGRRDGVPLFSEREIEVLAERFHREVSQTALRVLRNPFPIPIPIPIEPPHASHEELAALDNSTSLSPLCTPPRPPSKAGSEADEIYKWALPIVSNNQGDALPSTPPHMLERQRSCTP